MQILLPYSDFEETAYALNKGLLVRQRHHVLQLLQDLYAVRLHTIESIFLDEYYPVCVGLDGEEYECEDNAGNEPLTDVIYRPRLSVVELPANRWSMTKVEARPDRPIHKMWRGHEWYLMALQTAMHEELSTNFGYEDGIYTKTAWLYAQCSLGKRDYKKPFWLGDEDLHRSHQSYLLRSYPEYYKKFFPDTPDDLDMFWPHETTPTQTRRY